MTTHFSLHWLNSESNGYVDVFAYELFQSERIVLGFEHLVLGPKGKQYRAKCNLRVSADTAELDYEAFPDFCEQYGWYEGALRFTFTDKRRADISTIEWRDKGKSYVEAAAKLKPYTPKQIVPYVLGVSTVERKSKAIPNRPGQVAFREQLLLAYAGRCCLSGCQISAALEGAHIDPFYGPESDHPQNGLLLRHDLHDLFDAGLLAIEPKSLVSYFAPEVLQCEDYAALHGRVELALPLRDDCAPCKKALTRRWKAFEKRFGKIIAQPPPQG